MTRFYFTERIFYTENSNLINYSAGPIEISIDCWSETIKLSTKEKWKDLLKDCTETAKEAWELEDNQIKNEDLEVLIKFNFKNLKNYIEHEIVFI